MTEDGDTDCSLAYQLDKIIENVNSTKLKSRLVSFEGSVINKEIELPTRDGKKWFPLRKLN